MVLVEIDKKKFKVNENEFLHLPHEHFTYLHILDNIGYYERIIGLISELTKSIKTVDCFFNINSTHGGFLDIHCSNLFSNVFIFNHSEYNSHLKNITANIKTHEITNLHLIQKDLNIYSTLTLNTNNKYCILFSETTSTFNEQTVEFIKTCLPIMIINNINNIEFIYEKYDIYFLANTNLNVLIPKIYHEDFYNNFKYFIKNDQLLDFDNLLNLCIMVKNGGEQFANMLKENMKHIDTWTILDTGSTDDTIKIINETLVPFKKGTLYQEPFINFGASRNRLLELAGKSAKYQIMLDDTYILQGNIKDFLNIVRGDQNATSFSIFIKTNDNEYSSNRIFKSICDLKYEYKIHEVIISKNNVNVIIPIDFATINDVTYEYMEKRTNDRIYADLQILQEEIDENPNDPRSYYYMAQTYYFIDKYEEACEFYLQRANHPIEGFIEEKISAFIEAANLYNLKLNKPWSECEQLYLKAYELNKKRPEAMYFIGYHYYLENNFIKAFEYLKLAFQIGYPIHCQYRLRPEMSFYFIPRFLTQLCYDFKDYKLGEQVSLLFLENNKPTADYYDVIVSWHKIFQHINIIPNVSNNRFSNIIFNKPILCFVADGGFDNWTGSDILSKGIGGSETYIIEMARYIQKHGYFQVIVFCNCLQEEIFENVTYWPLSIYYDFISEKTVHTCIISRFSEYYPATSLCNVDNIYLVSHDLLLSGIVIPINNKLRKIFCLTEWHVEFFNKQFPTLTNFIVPFYYGIDTNKFNNFVNSIKIPNKFIYSSFPNRGLLPLLQMWPKIIHFYPDASLYIYSDIDGKYVNQAEPEKMNTIRQLLNEYKNIENGLNIFYKGWVNKAELTESWMSAEYWLYPCTFMETFCLTALESALSKTLVITNSLAALQNTVGNRGLIIEGDPTTKEWQDNALKELIKIMSPSSHYKRNQLIQMNYEWASTMSWEKQANKLLDEYLLQNKLEYKGMLNWTNNLPNVKDKQLFISAINYFVSKQFSNPKILEIGTYTGTSLINIVQLIPNSTGIGVDRWKNYNETKLLENIENNEIEKIFYKNVFNSGLTNRIKGIKGDSKDVLIDFIKTNQQYDFIYVDGSHKCFDTYSDIILAWSLLSKGGIFIIDDYYYGLDKIKEQPFEYPYYSINAFLENYTSEYILLNKGYRVFLEKNK